MKKYSEENTRVQSMDSQTHPRVVQCGERRFSSQTSSTTSRIALVVALFLYILDDTLWQKLAEIT